MISINTIDNEYSISFDKHKSYFNENIYTIKIMNTISNFEICNVSFTDSENDILLDNLQNVINTNIDNFYFYFNMKQDNYINTILHIEVLDKLITPFFIDLSNVRMKIFHYTDEKMKKIISIDITYLIEKIFDILLSLRYDISTDNLLV